MLALEQLLPGWLHAAPILPLYTRSRHLLLAVRIELRLRIYDIWFALGKFGRKVLRGTPSLKFKVSLVIPLLAAIMYKAFSYVLSVNEELWGELASMYDLEYLHDDGRWNVSELFEVFNMGYQGSCSRDHSLCIPQEHATRWVDTEDDESDGLDRGELLNLFSQLPQAILPRKTVERLRRLASIAWYLKMLEVVSFWTLVLLAMFFITWLYREMTDKQRLWTKVLQARFRHTVTKASHRDLKQQWEQSAQRWQRAQKEIVRLTDAHQRARAELEEAAVEMEAKERALTNVSGSSLPLVRKVHFLYASPIIAFSKSGAPLLVAPLAVNEEYCLLQASLAQGPHNGSQLLVDLATPRRLMELVLSDEPGLHLHVSCHGAEGFLQLEDSFGCLQPLHVDVMTKWLSQAPREHSPPEVVVLLCCHSLAVGQLLVEARVRRVVCTRGALPDKAARLFSEAFWKALAHPEATVEDAFHKALVLLRAQRLEDVCGLLALLPEAGTKTSLLPLAPPAAVAGRSTSASRPRRTTSLERPQLAIGMPEDFLGRELMLYQVLRCFEQRPSRRVVCVHGGAGGGKTAFASFLARFAHTPGRLFHDGVLYDAAWPRRREPMPWLWLEATWQILGQSVFEMERTGTKPDCTRKEELISSLCAELQRDPSRRWLLIVDDSDGQRFQGEALERFVGPLLERTNVSVLLTAKGEYLRDIRGGFKVVNFPLRPLDGLSSANLFLQRVRRPLRREDFEAPSLPEGSSGVAESPLASVTSASTLSSSSLASAAVGCTAEERKAHMMALLQHPLLQVLGGNPASIRRAAERVTPKLASLHDLVEEFSAAQVNGRPSEGVSGGVAGRRAVSK